MNLAKKILLMLPLYILTSSTNVSAEEAARKFFGDAPKQGEFALSVVSEYTRRKTKVESLEIVVNQGNPGSPLFTPFDSSLAHFIDPAVINEGSYRETYRKGAEIRLGYGLIGSEYSKWGFEVFGTMGGWTSEFQDDGIDFQVDGDGELPSIYSNSGFSESWGVGARVVRLFDDYKYLALTTTYKNWSPTNVFDTGGTSIDVDSDEFIARFEAGMNKDPYTFYGGIEVSEYGQETTINLSGTGFPGVIITQKNVNEDPLAAIVGVRVKVNKYFGVTLEKKFFGLDGILFTIGGSHPL